MKMPIAVTQPITLCFLDSLYITAPSIQTAQADQKILLGVSKRAAQTVPKAFPSTSSK